MATRCRLSFVAALLLLALVPDAQASGRMYFPDRDGGIGFAQSDVSGFNVDGGGGLSPIPGSPYLLGSDLLYIDGFAITPDGTRAAITQDFPPDAAKGLSINAAGAIAPVQAGFTPSGGSPFSVAVSPDGQHAYTTASGGVTAYSISAAGALTQIGPNTVGTTNTWQLALTRDGKYLFGLATPPGSALESYALQADGNLSYLGSTAVPTGPPDGIVASPDGSFLYTIDGGSPGLLATFAIGADGGLTQVGSPLDFGNLTSVDRPVIAPNGKFLYVPDTNINAVRVFALGTNGSPTVLPSGGALNDAQFVAITPDGRFIYVTPENDPAQVLGFALNADGTIGAQVVDTTRTGGGSAHGMQASPSQAPTAAFKTTTAAPGSASKFDAKGSADPNPGGTIARYDWDFGDGSTLANGGATPDHKFSKAGVFNVTLTVTNDQNCSSQLIWASYHAYCNGGPSAVKSSPLDTLPVLTAFTVKNKSFAVVAVSAKKRKAKKRKVKRGTTLRYTLSEAVTVKFSFERKTSGRKVGKKCKRQTKSSRKRRKCILYKSAGSISAAGKAGRNNTRFSGKVKSKKLKRGSYRVTAVGTDKAKGSSAPKTTRFSIVRG